MHPFGILMWPTKIKVLEWAWDQLPKSENVYEEEWFLSLIEETLEEMEGWMK